MLIKKGKILHTIHNINQKINYVKFNDDQPAKNVKQKKAEIFWVKNTDEHKKMFV